MDPGLILEKASMVQHSVRVRDWIFKHQEEEEEEKGLGQECSG